jgi:hypothetical protein
MEGRDTEREPSVDCQQDNQFQEAGQLQEGQQESCCAS